MRRNFFLLVSVVLGLAETAFAQQPPTPVRLPPPAVYQFDPKHVEVRHVENRWVLTADSVVLRDFGIHEADAREALRLIHALHLNQVGTIGSPLPVMEFWLSDGHAPLPTAPVRCTLPIDLTTLHAEKYKEGWVLVELQKDNNNKKHVVVGSFGEQRELAFQALDLIRQQGFSQRGFIGFPSPSMTYFLASPSEAVRWEAAQTAAAQTKPISPSPTPPVVAPERLRFDPNQVEVREDNRQWKLMYGKQVLANFGPDQHLAKQAQRLMEYYHFTEQLTIGSPENGFHYFLVNGQPPVGVRFSMQALPLRPEALLVRKQGQRYVVVDGDTTVMNFDDRLADAQQFIRVVQHHHFDRLCSLGTANGGGMTFLVKSR